MATIKICDLCGISNNVTRVRGYRWMGLMDKHDYKHRMLIKVDLCDNCQPGVYQVIINHLRKKTIK